MISIFAPAGIGEITAATDLAAEITSAVAADQQGPLADGDIVVVTSKIVSKSEGRFLPAGQRLEAIRSESVRTVARKGQTAIVQTRLGLTMAAAGVDNSNVDTAHILLLPQDLYASAERLCKELSRVSGARVGVIISDTAGRAWRIGQTDLAIGAAGLRVVERYDGRQDSYGNDLHVTAMAVGDELASAADLVKTKLGQRPVAVVRGLSRLVIDDAVAGSGDDRAAALIRSADEDLFGYGTREAVIKAVLTATGQLSRFEEIAALTDPEAIVAAVLAGSVLSGEGAAVLEAVLRAGVGSDREIGNN